jgi:hypothetical protein
MNTPKYTSNTLSSINYNNTWRGCIQTDNTKDNKSGLWELHATGDCDLDGRKYQALPAGTKLTHELRQKYNLM